MNIRQASSLFVSAIVFASLPASAAHLAEYGDADFKLVADPTGACKAKSECTVTLRLEALGAFHINDSFPYKFAGDAGVAWKKPAFSKVDGDFVKTAEKTGQMTLKFTPEKAGKATVAGTFKFSVCSAANCKVDSKAVSFEIPVK